MDIRVVLPGDRVDITKDTSIGPGVYTCEHNESSLQVARSSTAGMLRGKAADTGVYNKVWVDYSSKRYVPAQDERVLGVVTKTTGRQYRVDIGSAVSAVLPELAFEGATKRNKPNLQVGEVVYARVSRAHKDSEPELSCIDPSGRGNGLGALPINGYMFKCSVGLCRKLLSPSCPVLKCLGQYYKFECTVGMNGYVWVNCSVLGHTIVISNAIKNSQYMNEQQCKEMVDRITEQIGY